MCNTDDDKDNNYIPLLSLHVWLPRIFIFHGVMLALSYYIFEKSLVNF